jgi:hypothetical protein
LIVVELAAGYAEMGVDAWILVIRYVHEVPDTWDNSRITGLNAGDLWTILVSIELELRHRVLLSISAPTQYSWLPPRGRLDTFQNGYEPETT